MYRVGLDHTRMSKHAVTVARKSFRLIGGRLSDGVSQVDREKEKGERERERGAGVSERQNVRQSGARQVRGGERDRDTEALLLLLISHC